MIWQLVEILCQWTLILFVQCIINCRENDLFFVKRYNYQKIRTWDNDECNSNTSRPKRKIKKANRNVLYSHSLRCFRSFASLPPNWLKLETESFSVKIQSPDISPALNIKRNQSSIINNDTINRHVILDFSLLIWWKNL